MDSGREHHSSSSTMDYIRNIRDSGLTIYDLIEVGDPDLWIPTPELESLLNAGLAGMSVKGLPIRTRSKAVKQRICDVLGYPVPSSFKKTQPRFPGQRFDTYIQKSNNLQIWNEEISPTRRYLIIRVTDEDVLGSVRVVTGETLAPLDTTGTLTQKYQARIVPSASPAELLSPVDTENLQPLVLKSEQAPQQFLGSPIDYPSPDALLPIDVIFERLKSLVGLAFPDRGYDQERLRGADLHNHICQRLGYEDYQDDGRFPDVRHQLLEVKLQTSPTIDLGLVSPDSSEPLDIPQTRGTQLCHRDVRYAIFYGETDGEQVILTHFYLTTGASFYDRFPQFGGKVTNKKLQIPLPESFFDG